MDQSVIADANITGDIMLYGVALSAVLFIIYFTWPYVRLALRQRRRRRTYHEGGIHRK